MTDSRKIFVELLRDHINCKHSIIDSGSNCNWLEIQDYAKKHQMEGIIYYQTKNRLFLSAFSAALYHHANRESALESIVSKFNKPIVFVKGPEVAKMYPVPALRTMGDVDIIVSPDDKDELHELMIEEGYICNKTEREWNYSKGSMFFEVHDCLVYSIQRKTNKQEMFFNDCWKYRRDNAFECNFHFLFLLFHLRKHFLNQGVGFRQFLDIAVVSKRCDQLDWSWIENKLKDIDMFRFASIVFTLCNVWFDAQIPIICELDKAFIEETTNRIFDNGIFGFSNSENQKNVVVNQIHNKGKIKMLARFLSDIFLPFNQMKQLQGYSFLIGRRYLLPVAWGKRIIISIKTRKISILRTHYFVSNKEISNREEYLNKWGIQ